MTPQAKERRIREARERHNVPGQLNGYVLDVDSSITSYGKHNRLIVGRGVGQEQNLVSIREDKLGLSLSTEQDRRKVLSGYQNPLNRRERLVYLSSTDTPNAIWHEYAVTGGTMKTFEFKITLTLQGKGQTEEEAWEDAKDCFENDPCLDMDAYDNAECVEDEPDEPTEDDYTTTDHSHFYQYGKLALTVDRDATTAEMWQALENHMEKKKFWPNVYFISDHGNVIPMSKGE